MPETTDRRGGDYIQQLALRRLSDPNASLWMKALFLESLTHLDCTCTPEQAEDINLHKCLRCRASHALMFAGHELELQVERRVLDREVSDGISES